ncbi:CCA tRNA nucleotidyltransferase [Halalkalibacter krulwichiae]|uniref:CCA-adding enzyme n=1 Tax=Halalkalibacter krulwichiae TaxID=199441 RepID=A0A1X9MAA6_9BACI|nr:CCA tRNA nucleotidyltransferase [Halalkalibacter krulwichiae]ARK30338.1 CCA-adding enzyme [Halalkalibacter krulwichiae]
MQHWQEAQAVIQTLKTNGYEAYVVGGAVRDLLLQRPVADIDIVTTAKPNDVSQIFSSVHQLNTEHQTILVKVKGILFEVTTIKGSSLEEDLKARDLTINSLALNEKEELVDLVNGKQDLSLKLLRSVEPERRMTEDPLRMLRVFRFVSELGFVIDEQLLNTINKHRGAVKEIAIERVVKEWLKLIKGSYRNDSLTLMQKAKLHHSLPGLRLTSIGIQKLSMLRSLAGQSEIVCWTAYCICMGHEDEKPLKRLALSNQIQRAVKLRMKFYKLRLEKSWTPFELYNATLNVALDVENLRFLFNLTSISKDNVSSMWTSLPIQSRTELAITGSDLLRITRKEQGPWIRDALNQAERLVVTGECPNSIEDLIKALRRCEQC